MATAPKPGARTRRAKGDTTEITLKWDGKTYTARPDEASALDAMAFRSQSGGLALAGLIHKISFDPDSDCVVAVIWLARRQHGEKNVQVAEIAESIVWGDLEAKMVLGGEPEPEDPDSPEA